MTSPIGFEADDDADETTDDNVGEGCASLTPILDVREFAELAGRMRAMGATYVRAGDLEVRFPPPERRLLDMCLEGNRS